MKYFLEMQHTLPGNHDRGPVTEWRRLRVGGTNEWMGWSERVDGLHYMNHLITPGTYRLVDQNGAEHGGITVADRSAA